MAKTKREINLTHGMCYTSIYHIWAGMIQRCVDANSQAYKNYGGRGITVCLRWMNFSNFFEDMGGGYKKGLSIERINNDGNYELNNARWIPRSDQAKNRRTAALLTLHNRTKSITEWAKELNLNAKTLFSRKRKGWSVPDILNPSIYTNQHRKTKELVKQRII